MTAGFGFRATGGTNFKGLNMPYSGFGYSAPRRPSWNEMPRWKRKQFHQENESRARKGLSALPKPI